MIKFKRDKTDNLPNETELHSKLDNPLLLASKTHDWQFLSYYISLPSFKINKYFLVYMSTIVL